MDKILKYLKKHGESLDADIATAAGIPLATAHTYLTDLASMGLIMAYQSTRFQGRQENGGNSLPFIRFRSPKIAR